MTPTLIVAAGLFAEYVAECSLFFRQYETTDHDIALSYSQKRDFVRRMKTLLRDGVVLADVSTVGAGAACPTDETCVAIAISQAMSFGTLMYEDRSVTLWPAGARAAAEAAGSEMQDIVEAALDRVEAEMPDTDLVCTFDVFDLQTWRCIRLSRGDSRKIKKTWRQ